MLELGQRGVLGERLVGSSQLTPYTKWPWLGPAISAILAVLGLIFTRPHLNKYKRT